MITVIKQAYPSWQEDKKRTFNSPLKPCSRLNTFTHSTGKLPPVNREVNHPSGRNKELLCKINLCSQNDQLQLLPPKMLLFSKQKNDWIQKVTHLLNLSPQHEGQFSRLLSHCYLSHWNGIIYSKKQFTLQQLFASLTFK